MALPAALLLAGGEWRALRGAWLPVPVHLSTYMGCRCDYSEWNPDIFDELLPPLWPDDALVLPQHDTSGM